MQLLQRRWVAGHILALVMAGLFLGLGVWQLARNTHKHEISARRKAAYSKPAPDLAVVGTGAADGTRVEVRGTFDGSHETVLRNQVRNGTAGVHVLTPLRIAGRDAVLIDRGWVRASASSGLSTDPPPRGTAVVHGLIHGSNRLASADTVDHLGDGRLAVPRVDLTAIGRTMPYRIQPVWVEAQAMEPGPHGNAPALPQPPPPDPVNHLQYAIEWFAFALIPIIGWPLALRRLLRHRKPATSSAIASAESTTPVANRNGRAGSRLSKP